MPSRHARSIPPMRYCRFCGLSDLDTLRAATDTAAVELLVPVQHSDQPLGARYRTSRNLVWNHPSCLADEEQAHAAGELVRSALYRAAAEAARQGRLADSIALAEAAIDVLDAHYRTRTAA